MQEAIFAALGVYLFVSGLPSLIELAYRYYSLPPRFEFDQNLQRQLIGGVIGGSVDIAAGVALFFGARRLTEFTDPDRLSTDDGTDPNDDQQDDYDNPS